MWVSQFNWFVEKIPTFYVYGRALWVTAPPPELQSIHHLGFLLRRNSSEEPQSRSGTSSPAPHHRARGWWLQWLRGLRSWSTIMAKSIIRSAHPRFTMKMQTARALVLNNTTRLGPLCTINPSFFRVVFYCCVSLSLPPSLPRPAVVRGFQQGVVHSPSASTPAARMCLGW